MAPRSEEVPFTIYLPLHLQSPERDSDRHLKQNKTGALGQLQQQFFSTTYVVYNHLSEPLLLFIPPPIYSSRNLALETGISMKLSFYSYILIYSLARARDTL